MGVGERLPSLRKFLEDGFHRCLVGGTDASAVTTVTDILASTSLCLSQVKEIYPKKKKPADVDFSGKNSYIAESCRHRDKYS